MAVDMAILDDEFEFRFKKHTLKGRILNLGDIIELKKQYPDWQGTDISLLLSHEDEFIRLSIIQDIITRSLGGLNEQLPIESISRFLNIRNVNENDTLITEILRKAIGETDEPTDTEAKNEST